MKPRSKRCHRNERSQQRRSLTFYEIINSANNDSLTKIQGNLLVNLRSPHNLYFTLLLAVLKLNIIKSFARPVYFIIPRHLAAQKCQVFCPILILLDLNYFVLVDRV